MSSIDHGSTDAAPRGRHAAPDSGDPEVLEAPATAADPAVDALAAAAGEVATVGRELATYDDAAGAIVVPTPIRGLVLTFTRDQATLTAEQMHMLAPLGIEATWDPAQVAVFLMLCAERGFNPWAKEAYLYMIDGKYVHHVGIGGWERKAEETGEYRGMIGPEWCGPDGIWRDMWLDKNVPPSAARVGVLRASFDIPLWGKASYDEYAPMVAEWHWGEARGQKVFTGRKTAAANWKPAAQGGKPMTMLAKVAEAIAMRKAFPSKFGGMYAPQEFEKIRTEAEAAAEKRPPANDAAAARRREAYEAARQAAADAGPMPAFVGLGVDDDQARRWLLAELDEQGVILGKTRGELTARWSEARGGITVEQGPLAAVRDHVHRVREYVLAELRKQDRAAEADRYMHAPPVGDVEALFGRGPVVVEVSA